MARAPDLPFLPGFCFNHNLGRTSFHLNPQFDYFGENNRGLIDKVKPDLFGPLSDKFPSIYPRGEVSELPGWIAFDKQILVFDAYFQVTMHEFNRTPTQVRKVKIYFYLEDGTIQVVEPKVNNSGVDQGILIARTRIRLPKPMDDNFYDIIDLNVGREVEFFSRVFKIVNCDKFTRNFLNRCGISVPDPIIPPKDPYMELRAKDSDIRLAKKPNRSKDALGKFLENDRKVLRFHGYWDDRRTEFGYLHHLIIYFYLSDDTLEIKQISQNKGAEPDFIFLKRIKLPKTFKELPQPGTHLGSTLLNVLGTSLTNRRYVTDRLDCGKQVIEYYTEKDFSVGGILNVFGREITITDCDNFTKEYLNTKYGLEKMLPIATPADQTETIILKPKDRELPPWNGFGTHEDSAQNCITVEPKAPHKDFKKFLLLDRAGLDSHILRFEARMISKIPENCDRVFIISYYLCDDTIAVFEAARDNSGFKTSVFSARDKVTLPGQSKFTSKPPLCYTPQHMFVGATIIIQGFTFVLIKADEYALRYLELNPQLFPKANIKLIMEKVKEKLKTNYKDFVAENMPHETPAIPYYTLRDKLCKLMGDDFTEHEMLTIARAFSANCTKPSFERNELRAIALTELKRFLWDDLERLHEYLKKRDTERTGKLSRKDCYTVIKACRLPFDINLIEKILDVLRKDEQCNIYYDDLIEFLNRTKDAPPDVAPVNIKRDLWWVSEREVEPGTLIDWCAFNKYLDLEDTFKEPVTQDAIKALEAKNIIPKTD